MTESKTSTATTPPAAIPPVQASNVAAKQVKSGLYTTEFYTTITAAIGAFLAQIGGVVPEPWGVVIAGVAAAAYSISRGLAKAG